MDWMLLLLACRVDTVPDTASATDAPQHETEATATETAATDTDVPTPPRWSGEAVIGDVASVTWLGDGEQDRLGRTVAAGGDFDGDGQDDLVLGAYYESGEHQRNGKVYLFLGPLEGGEGDLDDATLTVSGEQEIHFVSRSVASAGDLDGDGDDELLIGAPQDNEGAGISCLFRGGREPGDYVLSDADACLLGEEGLTGAFGTGPGDVDGDGLDDVLVTAIFGMRGGPGGGQSYLVLGPVEDGDQPIAEVSERILVGAESELVGWFTDGAGDVDGDGYADYWLGAPAQMGGDQNGRAYLIAGTATPPDAQQQYASDAATLTLAEDLGGCAGASVAGSSDLTGDGQVDVAVGAWCRGGLTGGVYVYEGLPSEGTVDLAKEAHWLAGEADSQAGWGVAAPGDLDGDGVGELWVGAYSGDGPTDVPGRAYLLYGPVESGALTDADAVFSGGEDGDYLGWFLSAAGDVDGDGWPDLLIGAQRSDEAHMEAGRAHLLLAPW